ncbi:O-methylsterigmatocystin oxidoreductase [Mycena venus]|uniref:O-methylsterigmatocystin oxidoreductase n=1 Tax=Mycena venus TaxID=2733690 RepID=A0A8H6YWC5_9AGAR|nr:O-methylsterigmatocystin oxidoreductase [Mycena venus]
MGNFYDIPSELPWITYAKWGKEYGDVVHLQVFGNHVLVVNSVKAAVELFEKRGHIYSDRPTIPMVSLMGWDFAFTGMLYTKKLRQSRRMFHQHFRRDAMVAHRPIQLRKIHDLLRSLFSTPDDFIPHIKTLAVAIIMATTYGYDVKSTNDRFVYLAEEAVQRLGESVLPGAFAVNNLPFLRYLPSWFPGCGFHRFARETSEFVNEMKNAPFDFVRRNMVNFLEYNDDHGGSEEREEMMKDVVATAYGAAADTTAATLVVFIMAMALHPEVAQKAQNEIDSVIGLDRLPGFDDRSALPHCEAVYREVLRWWPAVPLAIPHATSEDDVYEGCYIPKGTMVLPNIWAMFHDESTYPNPDKFNPERFLNTVGQVNGVDHNLAFGSKILRYWVNASAWAATNSSGVITHFQPAQSPESQTIIQKSSDCVTLPIGTFFIPNFVDLHLHAAQFLYQGYALHLPLMEWLNEYAFKAEERLDGDPALARRVYTRLARRLIQNGTGTVLLFGTIAEETNLILAQVMQAAGLRAFVGKLSMDISSRPSYKESTLQTSLESAHSFVNKCRGLIMSLATHEQLVEPVLTPRFVPTCSDELLVGLGQMSATENLKVQSHLAEALDQVEYVRNERGAEDIEVFDRVEWLADPTDNSSTLHIPLRAVV